ncbi:8876_t:CDS:1, partial [Paraglomus occultum]
MTRNGGDYPPYDLIELRPDLCLLGGYTSAASSGVTPDAECLV